MMQLVRAIEVIIDRIVDDSNDPLARIGDCLSSLLRKTVGIAEFGLMK